MYLRRPNKSELGLLTSLVNRAPSLHLPPDWRESILVHSMQDGGMGSLKLKPRGATSYRKFGGTVSSIEFDDVDGVRVSAALNVDQNGDLFELDIWKSDFTPLRRLPDTV